MAKVAHRSLGEGGPAQSPASYVWQATATRLVSVPVSNNRIAASSAAGLSMYRCVVARSVCPAKS
jgi:hypothetical protein